MDTISVPISGVPTYAVPTATSKYTPLNFQDPCFLNHEIFLLWETHQQYADDVKADKSKLAEVGASLGELLYAMKSLLASECGRGGKWSQYLRQQHISRSTADRLVNKYAAANGLNGKSLDDAISEPTELEMGKLVTAVHEKCERVLPSSSSRFTFVKLVANRLGLNCEYGKDAFIIRDPDAPVEQPEILAPKTTALADLDDGDVL